MKETYYKLKVITLEGDKVVHQKDLELSKKEAKRQVKHDRKAHKNNGLGVMFNLQKITISYGKVKAFE